MLTPSQGAAKLCPVGEAQPRHLSSACGQERRRGLSLTPTQSPPPQPSARVCRQKQPQRVSALHTATRISSPTSDVIPWAPGNKPLAHWVWAPAKIMRTVKEKNTGRERRLNAKCEAKGTSARHPRRALAEGHGAPSGQGRACECPPAGADTHPQGRQPLRAAHRHLQLPVRLSVQLIRPNKAGPLKERRDSLLGPAVRVSPAPSTAVPRGTEQPSRGPQTALCNPALVHKVSSRQW